MAQAVKETPVLRGQDAERFEKRIKENETASVKVSVDEYRRALEVYKRIKIA